MKDVYEYALKAMEMLDAIGIKYGNVTSVTVNYRARRWGLCTIHRDSGRAEDYYTIEINHNLVEADDDGTGLMNTMLHELLHTAAPWKDHHGGMWKVYAEQVQSAYGYNIKRTSSEDDKGIADYMEQQRAQKAAAEQAAKESKRYQTYCPKCNAVLNGRDRLCKYTKDVINGFRAHRGCGEIAVLRDSTTGEIFTNVAKYNRA